MRFSIGPKSEHEDDGPTDFRIGENSGIARRFEWRRRRAMIGRLSIHKKGGGNSTDILKNVGQKAPQGEGLSRGFLPADARQREI